MTTDIDLYKALFSKLGEKEASMLVEFVKEEVNSKFQHEKSLVASKDDFSSLRIEMEKGFKEIEKGQKEMLKWIFGMLFAFSGLIISIMKFL